MRARVLSDDLSRRSFSGGGSLPRRGGGQSRLGGYDGGCNYADFAYSKTFLASGGTCLIQCKTVKTLLWSCLDGLLASGDVWRMNVEHIRRRLSGGFKPFALVTSSGDKFVVPHPEFIMLHPRTVVVMDKDGYAAVLDPLHVVGLQDVRGVENGRQKPRRR
jgi:hypothetical protein